MLLSVPFGTRAASAPYSSPETSATRPTSKIRTQKIAARRDRVSSFVRERVWVNAVRRSDRRAQLCSLSLALEHVRVPVP
eukprot:6203562-Pleurochrysis_carterae.AAC.1